MQVIKLSFLITYPLLLHSSSFVKIVNLKSATRVTFPNQLPPVTNHDRLILPQVHIMVSILFQNQRGLVGRGGVRRHAAQRGRRTAEEEVRQEGVQTVIQRLNRLNWLLNHECGSRPEVYLMNCMEPQDFTVEMDACWGGRGGGVQTVIRQLN